MEKTGLLIYPALWRLSTKVVVGESPLEFCGAPNPITPFRSLRGLLLSSCVIKKNSKSSSTKF